MFHTRGIVIFFPPSVIRSKFSRSTKYRIIIVRNHLHIAVQRAITLQKRKEKAEFTWIRETKAIYLSEK